MAVIAPCLDVLRTQMNQRSPQRSKLSDGWVGDPAHAARVSDHNPDAQGIVRALDITHDPSRNIDTWLLADIILRRQDRRLKLVISNGRIGSGPAGPQPGVWRKYNGSNNHAKHFHVSVVADARADDRTPWNLDHGGVLASPRPQSPKPKGVTEAMRQRMMRIMMGYEGRIPPQLHVTDGGPEISGITQKDHPQAYGRLKMLLDQGRTAELTAAVISYYDTYTDPAQNWTDRAGVEFFLRDCILNRGPTGAAEILQMALGVEVDHQIGPTTRGALAALDPNAAIDILRAAREHYENKHFDSGNGKKWRQARGQWDGLVNRWNKAQAQAKSFQKEQGAFPVKTTVGVGTGTGAAVVAYTFWDWITSHIIPSIIIACGVAAVVVFIIRKLKGN